MRQLTLASASFDKHSKQTRRAKFLAEMDQVVPWREMCAVVEPFYPRAGNGRPPIGLERMLRLHLLQHWFNLSDPAVEEALYDSPTMRAFAGIDLERLVECARFAVQIVGHPLPTNLLYPSLKLKSGEAIAA